VRITGFGSFKLRQRAARRGRNPQTGAPVKVKASKSIGFTPGVRLKADLNSRSAPAKPSLAPPKRLSTTASKATASKATASKVVATKATASKATASKVVATKATAKASNRTVRATPSKPSAPAGKKVGTRGR
jgi:DNA-binding protein HU-beta